VAGTDSTNAAALRSGVIARFKDVLRPYEPYFPARGRAPSWAPALAVLQQHGFWPATVFDIGVGFGTWGLYRAFPNAYYHLVDPTPESLPHMQRLSRHLKCDVHALALADRDGEAMLEIRADIQGSTLLEEVGPREVLRHERVPLCRFDRLFSVPRQRLWHRFEVVI
jgi:hypothetical protein